ncbi:MAG: rhodanese-like domain-containing protein [Desulfomonilaceae bacterium]|nr:rhodanese-like domain-containing protein [Desulfomonilaceae bacterium]
MRVFHAGLPAWKAAGHIIVSESAGLKNLDKLDASYVLIDLRSREDIEKGHIPKAVAAPDGNVAALKDQFPKYKKANIILYNENGDLEAATPAFKEINGWGYKMVSVLSGGLDAWRKDGSKIATGPAESKITYVRKFLPGEVDLDEFKALLAKPVGDAIILDVRQANETADGILPNAKPIPLDELEGRLAELPKDKTIVIHCSTGLRAEMAHTVLKKEGFSSKYLRANVNFDKEKKGEYAITD